MEVIQLVGVDISSWQLFSFICLCDIEKKAMRFIMSITGIIMEAIQIIGVEISWWQTIFLSASVTLTIRSRSPIFELELEFPHVDHLY